ncbi:G-alpha-domain-containing protein [Dentipellis sp. KUC8613]|nr:G-alpha-domain-containing protein [Dentipellis sp. KUC8613]
MTLFSDTDPLSIAWAPPANETPEAKAERLQREAAAQRVSDAIDESLRAESAALKKRSKVVKILLLGQSESDLQMTYAPRAWDEQRSSWRAVIQLNLIRSINIILDVLTSMSPPHTPNTSSDYSRSDDGHRTTNSSPSTSFRLTDRHTLLRLRLGPLRGVEEDLRRGLGVSFDNDFADSEHEQWATPFDGPSSSSTAADAPSAAPRRRLREFFVRVRGDGSRVTKESRKEGKNACLDDATGIIASCAEDMKALWEDQTVRALLEDKGVTLWQNAGFFLDDVERIAVQGYVPTDSDVVRARLRTIGIQEHSITFEDDNVTIEHEEGGRRKSKDGTAVWAKYTREWVICDVGGCRTSRHAWLPYFTDLTAILFLAPVSCFDETLSEDPEVNRLEDSLTLWAAIIQSPLLKKVMMILFLNKCDLLDRKLRAGVKFRKYRPGYGDGSNSSGSVLKYVRSLFKEILVNDHSERFFYCYPTCAIDTRATAVTLQTVRDGILREHLDSASLI